MEEEILSKTHTASKIQSTDPGYIVLTGGDELFFNEHVLRFYRYVLEEWAPSEKPIALYFGCSNHKPFSKSFIHMKTIRMLKKYDLEKYVQQFIISEPLTICPRELETTFPAANYDFPPERLGKQGKEEFIKRLRTFLQLHALKFYKYHVVFAPNHHKEIFCKASEKIIKPIYVPYNLYQLPNLLKALTELV
jgi:predicted RNA-binding protein